MYIEKDIVCSKRECEAEQEDSSKTTSRC